MTFERVTSPSQKGHKGLPGMSFVRSLFVIYIYIKDVAKYDCLVYIYIYIIYEKTRFDMDTFFWSVSCIGNLPRRFQWLLLNLDFFKA